MGPVVFERAYYYCEHCQPHHGFFPTDSEFGIEERKSPAAREVTTLVGTLDPFRASAEQILLRLTGLNESASTVRRTTEASGRKLAERCAAGETFASPDEPWKWNTDAAGERVAYVSLDATGVLQQGPHGEKAEGRMPWVGAVFNAVPTHKQASRDERQLKQVRYVAGLLPLEEICGQLRRECQAAGVDQADVVVALSDGGNGLEDHLLDMLGGVGRRMVFILDFWHAADKLVTFSKLFMPDDASRRQQIVTNWCATLKHVGGQALLADLQSLDLSAASPPTLESYRLLLGYIRSNLHRMDYPLYVARGWQIGSGVIESACKTVIGARLKGGGMRWRPEGTNALAHLRALYKSHPSAWKKLWARPMAQ